MFSICKTLLQDLNKTEKQLAKIEKALPTDQGHMAAWDRHRKTLNKLWDQLEKYIKKVDWWRWYIEEDKAGRMLA
ncbi:hypothetical protein NDU88_006799 [Pleurodeles waltl]|uniref:Uncharacterized protein n=1 Tax=Pleurodeles waltl TaxID=8319 RepID=A0AAV7VSE7_PLEWA|nr:hypothetical protein NDU88_006799 [Pleurodeles waltl]